MCKLSTPLIIQEAECVNAFIKNMYVFELIDSPIYIFEHLRCKSL